MRLIDADALPKYTGFALSADEVATAVENAPTVDAVEVVRCKDCKHNYHNMIPDGEAEYGCTKCIELPITANFYCAWGERREDETD